MEKEFRKAARTRPAREGRGRQLRSRPRRRGDRGDHLLHQHLEPERDDRRRAARPQRGRQGPQDEALGEDLAGARLAGRRRVFREGRACRTTSTRSASTSSASAAPPASAIPARCPENVSKAINDNDLVAVSVLSGNRNFEGRVNPDVRANYLASPPLVVAYALAGLHAGRPRQGAARHGRRRQAGLPQGHLAVLRRGPGLHRPHVTSELFKTRYAGRVHGRRQLEEGDGRAGADLRVGRAIRPMCRTRPISRA